MSGPITILIIVAIIIVVAFIWMRRWPQRSYEPNPATKTIVRLENADITYAYDASADQMVFSAHSAKGEQWMGQPKIGVSPDEAGGYSNRAQAAGMLLLNWP